MTYRFFFRISRLRSSFARFSELRQTSENLSNVFIFNNQHKSGRTQFKPELFKGPLYFTTLPRRKLNTEKVRNVPKDTQPVSGASSESQTGPLIFGQSEEVQERWQSLHSFNKYPGTANSGLGTECIRPWEHFPQQEPMS